MKEIAPTNMEEIALNLLFVYFKAYCVDSEVGNSIFVQINPLSNLVKISADTVRSLSL